MIIDMAIFSPPISLSNQFHLDIMVLLLRYQNKITEKSFKIVFSLIPNMIIRTSRIWESHMHISFHFLFITISIYVFPAAVKTHVENSVHKDQKLSKNFNGSNWTQFRLKMWPETLIFFYRNSNDIKHGLV